MDISNPISPIDLAIPPAGISGSATVGSAGRPSLRDAVTDVETMFLSLVLKEMRQTLESEGGLFAGDSGDVYGGLFDFYLGKHLADAGGVGLAATLAAPMEQSLRPEPTHDANPRSAATGANVYRPPAP